MSAKPRSILRTYLALTALSTLASSFIWGINTLFLLDAGLSVTQAFAANACFTAGQVLFEVPTGVVADTWGRRASYLLGSATLFFATLLYLLMWRVHGPFWAWAVSSALLGLGFTFFSGATEAWLVDGLGATGYQGTLEAAFAKGQIATGAGMLGGTLAGGALAQVTNLGVPYVVRAVTLGLTFAVALAWMRDVGFTPRRRASVASEVRSMLAAPLEHGLRNPPVRWTLLALVFSWGVPIYGFYAIQPYLMELRGRNEYALAGVSAAIAAAGQIAGGAVVRFVPRVFRRRTSALLCCSVASVVALLVIGWSGRILPVLGALAAWAVVFSVATPIRQAFVNELIPAAQRATILSSGNLLGSLGGVGIQPALGRVAEGFGYATSYLAAAGLELLAVPFLALARRERARSDDTGEGAGREGGAARRTGPDDERGTR